MVLFRHWQDCHTDGCSVDRTYAGRKGAQTNHYNMPVAAIGEGGNLGAFVSVEILKQLVWRRGHRGLPLLLSASTAHHRMWVGVVPLGSVTASPQGVKGSRLEPVEPWKLRKLLLPTRCFALHESTSSVRVQCPTPLRQTQHQEAPPHAVPSTKSELLLSVQDMLSTWLVFLTAHGNIAPQSPRVRWSHHGAAGQRRISPSRDDTHRLALAARCGQPAAAVQVGGVCRRDGVTPSQRAQQCDACRLSQRQGPGHPLLPPALPSPAPAASVPAIRTPPPDHLAHANTA